MADPKKRLSSNVAGNFYVDSTCIDCDACRQIAPSVFSDLGRYSSVTTQPATPEQERETWRAILSCPVAAIGCSGGNNRATEIQEDFPLLVEDKIYYCGFTSRKSYGANSYFIKDEKGNCLVESPRYVKRLAEKLDSLGGVKYIFLSHRDDVADADKYAAHWNSTRIIHKEDLDAEPDAEEVIDGEDPIAINEDLLIIPTPGHSRGHCVLLYKNKYLFTGDHLYWDRKTEHLEAFEDYCWYSWDEQKKSMQKLLQYDFQWVLPGHGQSVKLSAERMKEELSELVTRMQSR